MLKGKNSIDPSRFRFVRSLNVFQMASLFAILFLTITMSASLLIFIVSGSAIVPSVLFCTMFAIPTAAIVLLSIFSIVTNTIICPENAGLSYFRKQHERCIIESTKIFIKEVNDIYSNSLKEAMGGSEEVVVQNDENNVLNSASNSLFFFNQVLEQTYKDAAVGLPASKIPSSWDEPIDSHWM